MNEINVMPTLDYLWQMYASDDEALDARIPFPDWVRDYGKKLARLAAEERDRDRANGTWR